MVVHILVLSPLGTDQNLATCLPSFHSARSHSNSNPEAPAVWRLDIHSKYSELPSSWVNSPARVNLILIQIQDYTKVVIENDIDVEATGHAIRYIRIWSVKHAVKILQSTCPKNIIVPFQHSCFIHWTSRSKTSRDTKSATFIDNGHLPHNRIVEAIERND